jgi:hypothetical protein
MESKLSNEDKQLADVMLALQRYAFDRVKNRQGMEWRLCISLWTVSVILLGFLLKGDIAIAGPTEKATLSVLAVLVPVLHFIWIKGAGRRGRLDMLTSMFWDNQLLELLTVNYDEDLQAELDSLKSTAGNAGTYSFLFQICTTVLLAIGILCATWK